MKTSEISGFHKLNPAERLALVKEYAGLSEDEVKVLSAEGSLKLADANRMIENVVGTMPMPLGMAMNFKITGRDYMVPMVLEEPSVVAAASNAAKMARAKGGFTATTTGPVMIGQIQITHVPNPDEAAQTILRNKGKLLEMCNAKDPVLVKFGGGAIGVECRIIQSMRGPMVIVHLLVDCRDAMGANAVNTMAEGVAPYLEELSGGKVFLRIISNLAVKRLARSKAVFDKESIGGPDVVEGILEAYAFAEADPYRCATHNKGVMNGIDAVVLATGNDFRAIEAGAHAFAAMGGRYHSLTKWEKNPEGDLIGSIELPLAVGLIGGATASHPVAKANVRILGVKTAQELAEVMASVGLAQNFAALRALATEGIQRGHMSLHARNIAIAAGAIGDEIEKVAALMASEKKVRMDRAKEILDELRGQDHR